MSPPPGYAGGGVSAGSGRGCRQLGNVGYHVVTEPLQEKEELHRGAKAWKGAELKKEHCVCSGIRRAIFAR